MEYIALEKCIDGHLYKINARNGIFGIFVKGEGKKHVQGNDAFKLSRHKFGSNFIEHEFHWDTGEPFGTVKPLEDLGEAQKFDNDKDMLKYLNDLTESERNNQ